ncbi:hypothetical protein ACGC1H_006769 [Rhizoctonia solani]|uniref:BRCT domain-containing protein n=1 Tax=Rhizoctonia solani TaxID=456999 RepID=A0A8H2XTP1_9AGAM|nr:unnamed protein product [Rhizoctonia solani]
MPFPVFPPQEKPRRTTIAPDPHLFVDHLGEPLPIFLHKDVPTRDSLIQLITQNGGELANAMRHAVYLIVDPLSSDGQDTIDGYGDRPDKRVLRPEWLGMCVAAGRLVIANDWAGCRLGRTPQPRKRPADEQDPTITINKQPRTDIPAQAQPQAQAQAQAQPQPSFAYPTYPIVPGYYPPQYPYYDPNPQPAQTPQPAPPIKKRNPRPPRQPNRPWTLEENIALYNFMSQHPAPTEREQATLVRRWAKETRPDRGRQSWVAHAFATSFKNWVKEYEAGNVNANPADFGAGPDPDGEAEADPDHQPGSPEFSQSTGGEFSQATPGTEQPPNQQYTFGPSTSGPGTFPSAPAQYTSPPNHSYASTPNQAYASPSHGQFATEGQGSSAQGFTGFAESQQQQLASGQQQLSVNLQQQLPSNQPQPQQPAQQIASPRSDDQQTVSAASPSNAAGFPPLYPMVYPPTATRNAEEGKEGGR